MPSLTNSSNLPQQIRGMQHKKMVGEAMMKSSTHELSNDYKLHVAISHLAKASNAPMIQMNLNENEMGSLELHQNDDKDHDHLGQIMMQVLLQFTVLIIVQTREHESQHQIKLLSQLQRRQERINLRH